MTFEEYQKREQERKTCEAEILKHLKKIVKILHDYAPDCAYLGMCYMKNSSWSRISFNNETWGNDKDYPLDKRFTFEEEE